MQIKFQEIALYELIKARIFLCKMISQEIYFQGTNLWKLTLRELNFGSRLAEIDFFGIIFPKFMFRKKLPEIDFFLRPN